MTVQRNNRWLTALAVAGVALLAAAITTPAARAQTFFTPGGSAVGDGPVDATATFTISPGVITITIQDLLANPTSVGQTVNGVNFALSDSTIAGSVSSQTGMQRTVNSQNPGDFTDVGNSSSPVTGSLMWNYYAGTDSNGSPTPGVVEVSSLGNMAAKPTIIGGPDASNAYSAAGGSITSGAHDPFLAGVVTLVLDIPTLTGSETITNMVFQFGTSEGEGDVAGVVPEPSTLAIAGLGALGFIGYGLRRRLKK